MLFYFVKKNISVNAQHQEVRQRMFFLLKKQKEKQRKNVMTTITQTTVILYGMKLPAK